MGIEPTLVVWDKRKQWPLPGSCRGVLEGPLLAYSVEKLCFLAGAKNLARYGAVGSRGAEGLPLDNVRLT